MRDRVLHVLFTLALAWALLWLGIIIFGERMGAHNPARENTHLNLILAGWAPVLVAILTAVIFSTLLVKLMPRFLSIPPQLTSLRVWITLLVTTCAVGATLLLVLGIVTVILDPPGPHPDNVQYIPLVFWLPPLVSAVVTPTAGILVAWGWLVRHAKHLQHGSNVESNPVEGTVS